MLEVLILSALFGWEPLKLRIDVRPKTTEEVCIEIESDTATSHKSCFKGSAFEQRTYILYTGEYKVSLKQGERTLAGPINVRILESGECEYARSRGVGCA